MARCHKEVEALLRAAVEQGFTWRRTAKNHIQVRATGGQIIAIGSGTPSDGRSIKNFRADLKRGGVVDI